VQHYSANLPAVFADVVFIYSSDVEYVVVVGDNLVSFTVNKSHMYKVNISYWLE